MFLKLKQMFSNKDSQSISVAATAKSLQSCPTLCDPIDSSPPGSPIPRILQARTLEWVAISFSNAWKWKVKVKSLSCVQLSVTPWTAAYQAPPSMGFSSQEYWSGVPLPSPRSLLNISCIFSIHDSILLLRSWIIFTTILNSFSGKLSISSSFIWSFGFLLCSFNL